MLIAPLRTSDSPSAWPLSEGNPGIRLAALAEQALLLEVGLTPKPGLVDLRNSGAHRDMDFSTFVVSARAISPWFGGFFQTGWAQGDLPDQQILQRIRPDGLACERAMFSATGGVNTHKGSIFAFGLLCAAAGRRWGRGQPIDAGGLCGEVAALCGNIVGDELAGIKEPGTAGERLYVRHGLTGARGEAASGFATVRRHSLPALVRVRAQTGDERLGLFQALLELLAHNPDTNLVARGGMEGLAFVQAQARGLLADGGIHAKGFLRRMEDLDDILIERRLSPGGSADLLAVTWFLSRLALPHAMGGDGPILGGISHA